MPYKKLVKIKNKAIISHKQEYIEEGANYTPPSGYEEVSDEDDYSDYLSKKGSYVPSQSQEDINNEMINLKMRIDAGKSLSIDMSAEQTELDNLMGV